MQDVFETAIKELSKPGVEGRVTTGKLGPLGEQKLHALGHFLSGGDQLTFVELLYPPGADRGALRFAAAWNDNGATSQWSNYATVPKSDLADAIAKGIQRPPIKGWLDSHASALKQPAKPAATAKPRGQ